MSMNGVPVGRLTRRAGGIIEFTYQDSWLESDASTPISLSLPLSSGPTRDDAVVHFIENLMPDTLEVRQRLQRAVGAESTRAFDLLAEIGGDCVGALQFHGDEAPPSVREIRFEAWTESQVAEHLRGVRSGRGIRRGERAPFRISIAGAQEKTALLRHASEWCKPEGPTPTTHILKPAIGTTTGGVDLNQSVENEWLCSRILNAFGLPAARGEIVDFEDQRVLVVERFDRRPSRDGAWWVRLPQEDLCQATGTPPGRKYESDGGPGVRAILGLLKGAVNPLEDRIRFVELQLVYWLLAAIDGHAKNFSLALLPGAAFSLTPVYDVLSAHPIVEAGGLHEKELSMAMALEGTNRHYKWLEIRPRHLLESARRAGIAARLVERAIDRVLARVPVVIQEVDKDAEAIDARIGQPILKRMASAAERFQRLR